jgi:potassium-dependent mechanosensitive channel
MPSTALRAQNSKPNAAAAAPAALSANPDAQLPGTPDEIDRAIAQIESRLAHVRERATAAAPEATPDERVEKQRLVQQWTAALDLQSRLWRRLNDVRRLNQERATESQNWRGFTEPPPYSLALVEGLRDAIAGQRLEVQNRQMMLTIFENGVEHGAVLLENSRKQARLVRDQTEETDAPSPRRLWLLQLADARVQAHEAMVEASEKGRLVMLESLSGLRQYITFLERKLAAAQIQARFTKADFDAILVQQNDKREALRIELNDVITKDAELRRALADARDSLRQAQSASPAPPADRLQSLRIAVRAGQIRAETSEFKVDFLRGFQVLADKSQDLWEDRFWATSNHSLAELRNKRQVWLDTYETLRPWKIYAELKLSAAAQASNEANGLSGPHESTEEQELAKQSQPALDERVAICQRALNKFAQLENLRERLLADLAEQEGKLSFTSKAQYVLDGLHAFLGRLWNTELYVAEASVIADGQKISVPRIITLGKVAIALGIFMSGMAVALWGRGAVKRTAFRWFKAGDLAADIAAKTAAGLAVIIALFVAMASVRIPWTIFAFMGGALAIGVGFGAQTLINNFISGLILLFEQSIRAGDIVQVGGQRGRVDFIGFRNSLIRRPDGVDVLVPNSKFLESEVVNWTLTDNLVQYKIAVGVAYGSSLNKVSALLAQAAQEHPTTMKTPAPKVLLEEFGDNTLMFALVFWISLRPGVDDSMVRSELRHRIHALLEQAGIALAFPQRDVHLDSTTPIEVKIVNPPA